MEESSRIKPKLERLLLTKRRENRKGRGKRKIEKRNSQKKEKADLGYLALKFKRLVCCNIYGKSIYLLSICQSMCADLGHFYFNLIRVDLVCFWLAQSVGLYRCAPLCKDKRCKVEAFFRFGNRSFFKVWQVCFATLCLHLNFKISWLWRMAVISWSLNYFFKCWV